MIRIIGIGSPFGDDAVGLEAARRIAADRAAEIEVVLADRPGIALIDLLRDVPVAIVIDAVRSGRVPGTVHDLDLGEIARLAGCRFTSHDASLPEALALAEALGHALRGRFLGVEIGEPGVENIASGFTLAWFRTPYGVRCERVDSMLAERGLTHFHWDLDPQEWKHNNSKKAYDYVTKQLGKMTGRNVLLMHDIKKATVEALPQILDWIDQENEARRLAHKRRIRIIQSYELAAERLPSGMLDWLGDAADPHRWTSAVATVLP